MIRGRIAKALKCMRLMISVQDGIAILTADS